MGGGDADGRHGVGRERQVPDICREEREKLRAQRRSVASGRRGRSSGGA
jgi:hypothetical protein